MTQKLVKAFGPAGARIAIVGEAPGPQEELAGIPFQGSGGAELRRMLSDAGINLSDCFQTYVFPFRPKDGKVEHLCGSKKEVGGKDYTHQPISTGKYLKPEFFPELSRLREELIQANPNIVIALGNVACWALLGSGKITSVRGTIAESSLIPGLKVLPTYHPVMILRQWDARPIMVVDLIKARKESLFPEIRRKPRELWLEPTIGDIQEFFSVEIFSRDWKDSFPLAFDIETKQNKLITCIGFAPTSEKAIVIPFYDSRSPSGAFWKTAADEIHVWRLVQKVLEDPSIPKLGQNGLYDIQYLWRVMKIRTMNYLHDTMILQHAKYLELQKGLGFQGSIYTNEAAWKTLRAKVDTAENKRDE
jgi:DNA polymerase